MISDWTPALLFAAVMEYLLGPFCILWAAFVFKVCVRACARALGAWRWRGVLHPLT